MEAGTLTVDVKQPESGLVAPADVAAKELVPALTAEAACERLRLAGVASHLTRTLPRQSYWSEMLLKEAH